MFLKESLEENGVSLHQDPLPLELILEVQRVGEEFPVVSTSLEEQTRVYQLPKEGGGGGERTGMSGVVD